MWKKRNNENKNLQFSVYRRHHQHENYIVNLKCTAHDDENYLIIDFDIDCIFDIYRYSIKMIEVNSIDVYDNIISLGDFRFKLKIDLEQFKLKIDEGHTMQNRKFILSDREIEADI